MVHTLLILACTSQPGADTSTTHTGTPGDGGTTDGGAQQGPTWNEDVAVLVQEHCAVCHHADGAAPMALDSYAAAAEWGYASAAAVQALSMPPSNVDASGGCQDFANARWLPQEDRDLLSAWAEAGTPLGIGDEAFVTVPELPSLDQVDAELHAATDHTIEGSGEQWRCYVLETDDVQQGWLTGYQIQPADPSLVHHATVYSLPVKPAVDEARALDAADPDPGYSCPDGVEVGAYEAMALYNPGTPATAFPDGTGLDFAPTRPLLMRAHYTGQGAAGLTLQLDLADDVEREAELLVFSNDRFELDPGQEHVEISVDLTLPGTEEDTLTVHGVNPHMHDYGRTQRFELDPDGDATCLSTTLAFQPDWQMLHWYTDPLQLTGGQPVRLTCGYDTTDATEPIHFGQSYADEMCVMQLFAVVD